MSVERVEPVTGAGTSRPWILADGECWVDLVLMNGGALSHLTHCVTRAAARKDVLLHEQWWDANLHETRVLVRWGPAADHGGVKHLPDGGVVVTYPDGRTTF